MFLMANLDGDYELIGVNIISYEMIKLSKCGGLYTKAIERWQIKTTLEKNIWENFGQHSIAEFKNISQRRRNNPRPRRIWDII